jgi:NAD(P)-dependent dehydrogenase (short-subunit alcohol dehydrogenase family)
MGRLDGKVAVVTGGARGIGRGICRRFGREGASVLVADVAEEEGAQVADDVSELGGKGFFLRTDVMQRAQVEAMIATAKDHFGSVDILVNDAIALSPHVELEAKTDEMFDFMITVGLSATRWAMQAAYPVMKANGGGRIINLYSADADIGQWLHADYNATKGAIKALTVSAAAEWGRFNILCNMVAPAAAGTVFHELVKKIPELAEIGKSHPLGRIGDPETDVAPVVLFLSTEDSQYVNGQTIYVDGGWPLSQGAVYPQDDQQYVDQWLAQRREG